MCIFPQLRDPMELGENQSKSNKAMFPKKKYILIHEKLIFLNLIYN